MGRIGSVTIVCTWGPRMIRAILAHCFYPVYPSNHLVNRLSSKGPLDPLKPIQAVVGFEGRGVQSWEQARVLAAEEVWGRLTVTLDTWQLPLISPHRPEEKLWAGPPGEGGANQRDDRSALSPSGGSACGRGKASCSSPLLSWKRRNLYSHWAEKICIRVSILILLE